MSEEEVNIIKLRDVVRGNWKAIEKLKKQMAEALKGGGGGSPQRKRYIEAKFSDSVQTSNTDQPAWFGCASGIEIDAEVSGKELAKAVDTQQKQVEFFVNKWMTDFAKRKTEE